MVNVGEITAHLVLETDQFNQGMQSAQNSMNSTSQSAHATSKSIDKIHQAALAVGAVVVGTFAASVGAAANFEQKMKDIEAVAGATGSEMEQLGDLAKEMGAKTAFSASEAAMGIEELIKAGLTVEQVIGGGLEGALNLATAGGLQLAEAAEIASTALNSFKDDNLTVADSANILAGAANASATDVREMKFGLSQVSAVAAGAGLSFQDTATALASFAMNGLKGSDAGTSLKTMLQNLQPRTEEQIGLFEELGLMTKEGANAFYDMNGEIKSMPEIAGLLQKSMKDMTDQQRSFALETIFGSDAVRAGNILFKEGAEGLNEMWAAMSKVTAADVATTKMETLNGAFLEFQGAVETIGIKIGEDFLPILTQVVRQVTGVVRSFDDVDMANLKAALAFGGTAAAVALVATTVGKLTVALRVLSASPIGLAISGVALLAGAFAGATTKMNEMNAIELELLDTQRKEIESLNDMAAQYDDLKLKLKLSNDELGRYLDINNEINRTSDPNVIKRLRDEQDELQKKSGLTNEEFSKFIQLNGEIVAKVPASNVVLSEQGNIIVKNTDAVKALSAAKAEQLRIDLQAKQASLEADMGRNLAKQRDLQKEVNGLMEKRLDLEGKIDSSVKRVTELEGKLNEAKKTGNEAQVTFLNGEIDLENKKLQRLRDQHATNLKKLDTKSRDLADLDKEIGKLDTVKRQMVDLELRQAGINAKRGEELRTIDSEIGKLQAAKKKLEETTPVAQRNTGEFKESVNAIQNQIGKLETAKSRVIEIIGQAGRMNSELGKAIYKNIQIEETVSRQYRGNYGSPRENYHTGGLVGRGQLPKLHVGGLASEFASMPNHNEIDTRLLRNEMVLTEAQQSNLMRMIDAGFTKQGGSYGPGVTKEDFDKLAAAMLSVARRPMTVEVDGREIGKISSEQMSRDLMMMERMYGFKS
jgi:TP901 family phage tail tape measure protein